MKTNHECVIEFNVEFDSNFCAICDEWKSAICSDEDCEFCQGRPSKPSEITD